MRLRHAGGPRLQRATWARRAAFSGYRAQCAEKEAKIAALLEQRVTDQVTIAQLRVRIVELGGDP